MSSNGKRRRVILIAVACLVAVVVAFVVWPGEKEPEYQGKKLSEWAAIYVEAEDNGDDTPPEATDAFRVMGTNSLPWLIAWVTSDQHVAPWRTKASRAAAKLPNAIGHSAIVVRLLKDGSAGRAARGYAGFRILGGTARPAIPELNRMLTDPKSAPHVRQGAMLALEAIGEEAFPWLLKALSDPKQADREWIAFLFWVRIRLSRRASSRGAGAGSVSEGQRH